MSKHTPKELYRYEDSLVSKGVDEWGNSLGSYVEVYLHKYRVIKETPKGFWVSTGFGDKRFVLKECRKRFACVTKEQAAESFIARKKRQASILRSRADTADRAIDRLHDRIRWESQCQKQNT